MLPNIMQGIIDMAQLPDGYWINWTKTNYPSFHEKMSIYWYKAVCRWGVTYLFWLSACGTKRTLVEGNFVRFDRLLQSRKQTFELVPIW